MDRCATQGGGTRSHGFYLTLVSELEAYAEHEFRLNKTDQNGVRLRDSLEQVRRQTGRTPEELKEVKFPKPLSFVWASFIDLSNCRTTGFNGPNPITYEQIKAWKDVTESPVSPRDVETIRRLDNIFMKVYNG